MRRIELEEKKQRGCGYCLHYRTGAGKSYCPFDECPYHELDNVTSYEEYLESQNEKVYDFERIFQDQVNRGII